MSRPTAAALPARPTRSQVEKELRAGAAVVTDGDGRVLGRRTLSRAERKTPAVNVHVLEPGIDYDPHAQPPERQGCDD